MASSSPQAGVSATLAAGNLVRLTQPAALTVLCQSSGDAPARGKILESNLSATRVTDPHRSVVVIN